MNTDNTSSGNQRPSAEMLEGFRQGALSDSETRRVQAWLMDNPEVLEAEFTSKHVKDTVTSPLRSESRQTQLRTLLLKYQGLVVATIAVVIALGLYMNMSQVTQAPKTEPVGIVNLYLEKNRSTIDEIYTAAVPNNYDLRLLFDSPKPTEGQLMVTLSQPGMDDIQLGNALYEESAYTVTIPFEEFNPGVWTVRLTSDSGVLMQQKTIDISYLKK